MKTEDALEIIEVIDDDSDAFGERSKAQAVQDTEGRRWVGPVAAAALVGLIGYGVATSSGVPPKAAPITKPTISIPTPPTFSPPSTSVPVQPAPKVTLIAPQYYVADPVPAGFTMHFAETLGMGGNPADFTDSTTAQLWATDGARADTGSWFVVSLDTQHATGRNAYRTIVGDTDVVVERDPFSGQKRLSFNKDGSSLEITAFGWADRQLMRLVDSVFVRDAQIQFHDAFFTTDHEQLFNADPPTALYGLPVAWVGYTTAVPASLATSFTITVAAFAPASREIGLRFGLTNAQPFTVGGLPAIFGLSAADPQLAIVQWVDGDRLITMRGNLDVAHLMTIAETVHAASVATVSAQVQPDQPLARVLNGEHHPVDSGWLDGPWLVQVSGDPNASTDVFVWWIGDPAATRTPSESWVSVPGPGPSIETIVESGKTYVLGKVPRSMAGATLHVNRNGLPSIERYVIDVDAGLGAEFAAYAFTEPVPYTAQLVAVDGSTVATWPKT